MKIISFEVVGLFGRVQPISLDFNSDMNILTGRNGAGKTSIMKLIWYILSGNIEFALIEINFSKAVLVTDLYTCTVLKISRNTCKVEFSTGGNCSGLMKPDTLLGENARQIEVSDDQTTPYLFR
ncbi:AAA family ATPase, partial [Pseudomonas bubulae]|uniref:AAA family ATPase n=1 Tax=Pseudomonas bubulae TaxID=2316085 RepID=UPI003D08B366